MSTITSAGSTEQSPWRPALPRAQAMRLAAEEYRRVARVVEVFGPEQWRRPTDCPAWNVRELVAHIVGMAALPSSPFESARQLKKAGVAASSSGGAFIDALTALQVRERMGSTTDELVRELQKIGPKAVRGRLLIPGVLRHRVMNPAQYVSGREEWWSLGFLIDTVLTRDPWMHRIDLGRATGQTLPPDAGHDGVIVADVVREWATRHGQPYRLRLTGDAGGSFSSGVPARDDAVPTLELDALEFCRILSGRKDGVGLLSVQVAF
ncbi:maleylpyruvate isomerase family mycothiol-dependent enzyme [Arthrobacter sp. UYEF3]|uniref:maleylpyruvate isomerase family mycothiol-dependent enzyme n=1 Tax=Arthrobacter sp. UYEF3 TaxID=1756365 RepID=UPI003395EDC6